MQPSPKTFRAATRHLARVDPVMARLVRKLGPCRLQVDARAHPFASLVEAIVYQQLHGKAAATIHARLLALAGRKQPRPQDIAAVSDAALRGAGLSRQKTAYLRDLTRRVEDGLALGRLHRLPDEEVTEALTSVKGIGRWTAQMFLIFRLGRLDVLPVDDYGVRKSMQRAYGFRALPTPDRMCRVAEAWRPYRTIASWYLWKSLDSA